VTHPFRKLVADGYKNRDFSHRRLVPRAASSRQIARDLGWKFLPVLPTVFRADFSDFPFYIDFCDDYEVPRLSVPRRGSPTGSLQNPVQSIFRYRFLSKTSNASPFKDDFVKLRNHPP